LLLEVVRTQVPEESAGSGDEKSLFDGKGKPYGIGMRLTGLRDA
jgi:hypothetical protein